MPAGGRGAAPAPDSQGWPRAAAGGREGSGVAGTAFFCVRGRTVSAALGPAGVGKKVRRDAPIVGLCLDVLNSGTGGGSARGGVSWGVCEGWGQFRSENEICFKRTAFCSASHA